MRIKIPKETVDILLVLNEHTCCICHNPDKPVQIHHIDYNNSNNELSNLAVLCMEHHEYAGIKTVSSKGFSPKEIKRYKKNWEYSIAEKNQFGSDEFRDYHRVHILKKFGDCLVEEFPKKNMLINYYSWHESNKDWFSGTGEMYAFTINEIEKFWSNEELYCDYESSLYKFIQDGGRVKRVFVFNHEFRNAGITRKILYRQHQLGMEVSIASLSVMPDIVKVTGITCDSFGALNHKFGYFLKFDRDEIPYYVRTIDEKLVLNIYNVIDKINLSGNDLPYLKFIDQFPDYKVDRSTETEVEELIEAIKRQSKMI